MPEKPQIAVVDVDKTLVAGSTGPLLAKHAARGLAALRVVPKLLALSTRLASSPDLAGEMAVLGSSLFAGKEPEEARELVERCFRKEIRPRLFRWMVDRIREHQAAGTRIWIAAPVPQPLADILKGELSAEKVFGVDVERDSRGRLTDRIVQPLCYREGKRDVVLAALSKEGISPARVRFYTDSDSDIPLLEAVGEPVCVNPTPKLETLARSKGWPIERFTETIG